jgi:PIN domain nuclease of toxin-antitoxin system
MKILLDTHVVLWWVAGDRRLRKSSRDLIASAETASRSAPPRCGKSQSRRTSVVFDMVWSGLPDRHGDPFDRMLIAQTIAEGRQLLTSDEAILGYSDVPGFAVLRA